MKDELNKLNVVILAAGRGTRMKSSTPKVLHKIANQEIINMVIGVAKSLNPKRIIIVSSEEIFAIKNKILNNHNNKQDNISFIIQRKSLGTAHALNTALNSSLIKKDENILVLYGDTPLIKKETLNNLLSSNSSVSVLAFNSQNSNNKYGRLVINSNKLVGIVEFKDANNIEKEIKLCNSGVFFFKNINIFQLIDKIDNNNKSQEYYLTDIIKIATKNNISCNFVVGKEEEILGINSIFDLSVAEKIMQNRLRKKLMDEGVVLLDPNSVYFSFDTIVERNVVIHQNVVINKGVKICYGSEIKPFSTIEDTVIGKSCTIGPFANLRPKNILEKKSKIGSFVEIKNSNIGENTKISHLSYIGDSNLGKNINIGAGSITCNYDGYNKHMTNIGNDSFIGSNTSLIAPITIENGSIIGAGSVITKNCPQNSLAISRSTQKNIDEWASKYHAKKQSSDEDNKSNF